MSVQGSHLGTRGLKSATAGMSLGGGHVGSDWSGEVLSKISRIETNSSSVLIGPELKAGVKIWTQMLKHSLPGKSGRENGMKERL